MIAAQMPNLVKGVGYARVGGVEPIDDDARIFSMAAEATKSLKAATKQGIVEPAAVQKSLSSEFLGQFGLFGAQTPLASGLQSLVSDLNRQLGSVLEKNFTLSAPLTSGFVPFDLVAPSRLIYPVYSPLRNKLPRTPGQGSSRRAKLVTGVQGSQTGTPGSGNNNPTRLSISELLGGNLNAQASNTFPLSLPNSGNQSAVDLNVGYKFFGLTESLSWLSQFSGQGFEDVSALANLILLQEAMLGEEYTILGGCTTAVAAPATPTLAVRTAGSNETAQTGVTTNVWVRITAATYFGETASAVQHIAWSSGQVTDVTLPAMPKGGMFFNVYVGTGSSDPTVSSTFIYTTGQGGKKLTLQGAIPTAGATPPTADSGTSSSNDYDGIFSILSGNAPTSAYPANFGTAGYWNPSVGDTLNTNVVNTALKTLWDGNSSSVGGTATSGFRADPSELIAEGTDMASFGMSILSNQGGPTTYQFLIDQNEVGNVAGGVAISQFTNPITRSTIKLMVHPWIPQGSSLLMSYTLPMSWSNVTNVWENVMVQDYLSISWPVIDVTFRYSLFWYGALVCYAPAYNGLIQGLQKNATTPYS